MNNKSKILMACLALLLVTSIGYALFSETVSISGTASAKGSFDMNFASATIEKEQGSTGASVEVIDGGNKLKITVPKLEYPGAYVLINYKLKNVGTIDAFYDKYTVTGETNNIKALFNMSEFYYKANEEAVGRMKIYWDESIDVATNETTTIVLNYSFNQLTDVKDACSKKAALSKKLTDSIGNKYERILDLNLDGYLTGYDTGLMNYVKPTKCN